MKASLTTKFNLLTIIVILITAISIGSLVLYREVTTNRDELVQRGLVTAGMLAQASEYGVYTENVEALKKVVDSARIDPDFAYLAVQNADNNTLTQESKDQVASGILAYVPQSTGTSFSEVLDPSSGRHYIDIRA